MRGRHSAEHHDIAHDALVTAFQRHRGMEADASALRGEGLRTASLVGAGFSFKGLGRTIRAIGRGVKHGKAAHREAQQVHKSAQDVAASIRALAN